MYLPVRIRSKKPSTTLLPPRWELTISNSDSVRYAASPNCQLHRSKLHWMIRGSAPPLKVILQPRNSHAVYSLPSRTTIEPSNVPPTIFFIATALRGQPPEFQPGLGIAYC